MPLDAHYLQVFKAVLTECSMSQAAMRLRTSASNVKRIVTALEGELGVPLFDREARGKFQPTTHAGRLDKEMAGFMKEMDSLQEFVTGMRETGRELKIGSQPWLAGTAYFVRLMDVLRQDHRFRTRTMEVEPGHERAMVESGACDVFIGLTTPSSKRLAVTHLPPLQMCVGHVSPVPLAHNPSELSEVSPWAMHAPELRAASREWLRMIELAGGGTGVAISTPQFREWLANPESGDLRAVVSAVPANTGGLVSWHPAGLPEVPVRAMFLSQHPYGCLENALQKAGNLWSDFHDHTF